MVQVRKLVLAIAAASALSSGMAQALQLGEMTLKSKLNQPLSVEIELLDVGGLTASEITPSLASSQAFVDAGVDRQAFLNDLTFTPVVNPNGRSVVRVTSSKPLPDSYVRFLLQVQWPNGRLMRDYSVLLDPAKFDQSTPAAGAPAPAPRLSAPATTAPAVTKAKEHTTTSRDTLWEIAAKNRNGASVQQTMLAIQALNPDAFIDGNINRMKTGQVLRLPDSGQSTSLPQPEAIAEVTAQNAAWREGRRGGNPLAGKAQLDATKRTQAGNAPSQTNAKDNLSLVSAEAARKGGKGSAGDSRALNNKLAVTQESLDSTRRENEELKSRMADLQSQLDKLQRLIELKNNQLAKLQTPGGAAAQPAATAAMPAEVAAQPAAAPAAQTPAATPAAAPVETAVKPEAAPASTEGKFNDLLTNPIVLGVIGGAAGLLVLLLLLLWARHRNARLEEEKHLRMARALAEEPEFAPNIDHDLPSDSFEGLDVPPPNVKLAPAPAPAPAPAAVVAPVIAPVVAPVAAQRPADAMAQAQSHIDRGHLNQAAEVLEDAIKQEPARSDLRLKLMEVHGLQGNKDGFVTQERQLVANGDNHAQVEQLKSRFPAMAVLAAGVSAAVAAAALDAQYVKDLLKDEPAPPAPEPAPDAFDTDFDLSLDDLEAASPAVVNPAPDDDLSFESVLQQQTEAKASAEDLSDFDLDLQLDPPSSTQSDDDFLSGLEDQMKDLPPVEPPTLTPTDLDDLDLPEDFDLSLADEPEAPAAVKPDAFASELDDVNAELDRLSQSLEHPPIEPSFTADDAALGSDEPEFDFLSGTDEVATKLDLAQAYIDMGDADGARDILGEVLKEGDDGQKGEAKEMLSRLA